jgi:5-methylcytosine-specific restriction endonuclease McrA
VPKPTTHGKKKTIPKIVKDLCWSKWIGDDIAKHTCLCCGTNEIKMNSFHCGHVVAESNGGPTTVDNLKPICATCNLSMGSENMDTFKRRCGFVNEPFRLFIRI